MLNTDHAKNGRRVKISSVKLISQANLSILLWLAKMDAFVDVFAILLDTCVTRLSMRPRTSSARSTSPLLR